MNHITVIDQHGNPVADHIREAVEQQSIFWSDPDCRHYFFDFQLPDGTWCSSKLINNELTEFKVELFK